MEALIAGMFLVLGLLLRPLIDSVARRRVREEDWTERLKAMTVDVTSLLWRGFTRNRTGQQLAAAYSEWENGLQRDLILASRFAPNKDQREACHQLWIEFEKLIRRTHTLAAVLEGSRRQESATERYEQAYGETNYALDGLVEVLGGPARGDRAAYPLSLRTDGDDGLADIA